MMSHRTTMRATTILLGTATWHATVFTTAVSAQKRLLEANFSIEDRFCGNAWSHAASTCGQPCPTGKDEECRDGLKCYYFTGCQHKNSVEHGDLAEENNDIIEEFAKANLFCGTTWLDAHRECSMNCTQDADCGPRSTCFAATNCRNPIEAISSDILMTLLGPDDAMENEDQGVFTGSVLEFLKSELLERGVAIGGVELDDQTVIAGKKRGSRSRYILSTKSREKYFDDFYHNNFKGEILEEQRILQSGSSALDVSVVVTGDYRPPPYLDIGTIIADSINRQGEKVVSTLRERGSRAGRDYFDRVDSIEAVAMERVTRRPTQLPTTKPTLGPTAEPTKTPALGPTGIPTYSPSMQPSYEPSVQPSLQPSRAIQQNIVIGTGNDLTIGGSTTSSYGYIFNIRTTPESPAIMITGVEFYTEKTDNVEFELWSRQGSFKDHKGSYEGWDLVASGAVHGRGLGRYTSIPEELFSPVPINGGGGEAGTRAFYLTLHSINLIYKLSDGQDSDMVAHAANQDLEIYEGEGVLSHPFPDPSDVYFYRYPRQFLGAINYDRLPCKPYSAYGHIVELPCPLLPTSSPTEPQPTTAPLTNTPTAVPTKIPPSAFPDTVAPTSLNNASVIEPTVNIDELSVLPKSTTSSPMTPTSSRTDFPTFSLAPTNAPTTPSPTSSPIVPMRANIVLTLANTPGRPMTDRELQKLIEIITDFLIRNTQHSMVIDGIDYWHQELTTIEQVSTENSNVFVSDDDSGPNKPSPHFVRGTGEKERKNKQKKQSNKEQIPNVHATKLILIVRVSYSNLPMNLLGKMAAVSIDEKQTELIALLKEQSVFYTYFKNIITISATTIDTVTFPPSLYPTTYKELMTKQNAHTFNEEDRASSFAGDATKRNGLVLFVGVGIGAIWCCLTIISVCYLFRVRSELKNGKKLEQLAQQEKSNNIYDGTGDGRCNMPLDCDKEKKCNAQTIKSELTPSLGVCLPNCEAADVKRQGSIRVGVSRSMQPTNRSTHYVRVLRRVKSIRDLRHPYDVQSQTSTVDPKISMRLGAASKWQSQSLTPPKEKPKKRERVSLAQSAIVVPSSLNLGIQLQHSPMPVAHKTSRKESRGRNNELSRSDVFQSSTATTRTPPSNRLSWGRNKVSKSMNSKSSEGEKTTLERYLRPPIDHHRSSSSCSKSQRRGQRQSIIRSHKQFHSLPSGSSRHSTPVSPIVNDQKRSLVSPRGSLRKVAPVSSTFDKNDSISRPRGDKQGSRELSNIAFVSSTRNADQFESPSRPLAYSVLGPPRIFTTMPRAA